MNKGTIIWFRRDLRLQDNAALASAICRGQPVFPVFIWSPDEEGDWAPGAAARWWLHHALEDLDRQLRKVGSRLLLCSGSSFDVLQDLLESTNADRVVWNRRYEPAVTERDAHIKEQLREKGWEVESFNSSLLFEPWTVSTNSGKPYRVYTPFRKNVETRSFSEPVGIELDDLRSPGEWPESESLDSLGLLPSVDWATGIREFWNPTREGGLDRLKHFLGSNLDVYDDVRDLPGEDGTSRLSPYLHWGQVGVREVAWRVLRHPKGSGRDTFVQELLWREFAWHVLYHFPDTPGRALQDKFRDFPWEKDTGALEAWQKGRTGYPIIDAGMRQLWETGWMHNRVRMIVGSLLVKHLLQPWQEGAKWFWDTLVDADLASNTLGWQWAGGCGADAAPYFRIFNPMTQGEKFDPKGDYVKRFVPELRKLPAQFIHEPWEAPDDVLEECGVRLGDNYPRPIVEHKKGRERALAAFDQVKGD